MYVHFVVIFMYYVKCIELLADLIMCVTSRVEKLTFRKLRVQKPEPPVLLCYGGQSMNRGVPHIATAAGHPRDTRRPSSAAVPPPHSSPRLKARPAPSPQTLTLSLAPTLNPCYPGSLYVIE